MVYLTKLLHLGSTIARLKLNKIGGNLFERWNMWFNAIIHAKPYQRFKHSLRDLLSLVMCFYGIAWLSSVRVVRCEI